MGVTRQLASRRLFQAASLRRRHPRSQPACRRAGLLGTGWANRAHGCFLISTLVPFMQSGTTVAVIEGAADTPHASTEGRGSVALSVPTPSLISPATRQETMPQPALAVLNEPEITPP